MNSIFINTTNGGYFYSATYFLAFITVITIFLVEGARKKISFQAMWLVISAGVLFFITGNKLFTVSPSSWGLLFSNPDLASHNGKTLLGGILFLLFGIQVAKRWLGIKTNLSDLIAVALPVGMAIARIGCLMKGCCFGLPADVPWAIHYPASSLAYEVHLANGLCSTSDQASLPVHPTQIYDMFFCLVIAFIAWRTRKTWKVPGNRLRIIVILYGISRVVTEFFRDPAGDGYAGGEIMGLKYIQWAVLAGVLFLLSLVFLTEKTRKLTTIKTDILEAPLFYRYSTFFFFLVTFSVILIPYFGSLEKLTLLFFFLPSGLLTVQTIYYRLTMPGFRLGMAFVSLSGLIFMSQTSIPDKKNEAYTYKEFSIGALYDQFNFTAKEVISKGCGIEYGPEQNLKFQSYKLGGGYSWNKIKSVYKKRTWGLNGSLGMEEQISTNGDFNKEYIPATLNPYFSYDWRYLGLKGGILLGYFHIDGVYHTANEVGQYEHTLQDLYIFPQFGFRFGPVDIVYLDLHLADQFPISAAPVLAQCGLGTGLGKANGTALRIGVAINPQGNDSGDLMSQRFYGQFIYPINNKYVIDVYLSTNFAQGFDQKFCIGLGFKYRFEFKPVL